MRIFLCCIALICGGCGHDGIDYRTEFPTQTPTLAHSPYISSVSLSESEFEYMEGGGSVIVVADLFVGDNGFDLESITIEKSDGSIVTHTFAESIVTGPGLVRMTEEFEVSTNTVGLLGIEIWLSDKAGYSSAHRNLQVWVIGDPFTWLERVSGLPNILNDITDWWQDEARYIAVGDGGTIMTSPDGITWVQQAAVSDANLNAISCDPWECLAVGESGTILRSWDGVDWEEIYDGPDNVIFEAIQIGLQYWFVAGADSSTDTPYMLRYTYAESTWNEVDPLPQRGQSITGIAAIPGPFGIDVEAYVATQKMPAPHGANILTSSDGQTWIEVAISSDHESTHSIVIHNQHFWAGGSAGRIYESEDGVNWTTHQTPASMSRITAMLTNEPFLVAHGTNDVYGQGDQVGVATSDDGLTWQEFRIGSAYESLGLAYADGRYVSVGRAPPIPGIPPEGRIYSTR